MSYEIIVMRVKIELENFYGKDAHEKYIAEYTNGTKLRVVHSYSPVVPKCLLTSWVHALVSDVTVYLLSDEEE
jgi:hypothetical protein